MTCTFFWTQGYTAQINHKKTVLQTEYCFFCGVSDGIRTPNKTLYIEQKPTYYIKFALFVQKIIQFYSIFLLSRLSDMSVNILRH